MRKKYLSAVERYFTKERTQGGKVCHKCIAALVCDQAGDPYIAIFAAGTRHNDEEECYHSSPCSMHAESLCFDTAPIFFQIEMSNCRRDKSSIFSFNENDKKFELKPCVKFHLLITEPPCGWIQHEESPRIEWMESSVTIPHVPTCSSKIFINSKLGIQGYVSHLLATPIFVDSVIILYDKEIKNVGLKTNFDPEDFVHEHFQLPNIVLLEYDPKIFSGKERTFVPMNLIAKHKKSAASDNSTLDSTPNKKAGVGDYGKGVIHIEHCDGRLGRLFQLISKNTKKDEAGDSGPCVETVTKITRCKLTITKPMVLEELQQAVDDKFQAERKDDMKQMYNDLTKKYGRYAIDHKLNELEEKIKSLDKTITASAKVLHKYNLEKPFLKNFSSYSVFNEYISEVSRNVDIIKKNGKKLFDHNCMVERIKQGWKPEIIGVENCVTIDCSWKRYFNNEFSSSVQPAADS